MKDQLVVECQEDCGNAPKKGLIRDCEIAFANRNEKALSEILSDDCVWARVGRAEVVGLAAIANAVGDISYSIELLRIDTIITHGNVGAANGVMISDGTTTAFCNVYQFSGFKNPKVRRITSYLIDL